MILPGLLLQKLLQIQCLNSKSGKRREKLCCARSFFRRDQWQDQRSKQREGSLPKPERLELIPNLSCFRQVQESLLLEFFDRHAQMNERLTERRIRRQ